jgi:GrpB-like predicted nucleotidyltransferase (UPF0157 family)
MTAVLLVESQAAWPAQARAAMAPVRAAFEGRPVRLEHIGSTAVPGLCAKPVLDLLLGVPALADAEDRAGALEALGFRYRPEHEAELPERRYFVRPAGAGPRVHLHAVVLGGPLWTRHLAFRDALRRDPGLAARYAALKRDLAGRHAEDKAAYTAAKAPFIAGVLAAVAPGPGG